MGGDKANIDALEARVADLEAQIHRRDVVIDNITRRTEDFAAQTDCWFWETDAKHAINYISGNLEEICPGLNRGDLVGRSWLELVTTSSSPEKARHVDDVLYQKAFRNFRFDVRAANGQVRHVVSSGWPVKSRAGVFKGYRGTVRDETAEVAEQERRLEIERHYVETIKKQGQLVEEANKVLEQRVEERTRELRELQSREIANERDATMSLLVGKICHELRNPLNALNTSLYVIKSQVGGDDRLTKPLERSERTIKRCTRILRDLYDYAMTEELKPATVDIGTWTAERLDLLRLPAGVSFEFSNAAAGTWCTIDPNVIEKAIWKVLHNALLAIGDEANPDELPRIRIELRADPEKVTFAISDTGSGMPEEIARQALQPMFSTRGFGFGLGLPYAQQSFRQHGGGLSLESKPGQGTTVHLWLPIAEGSASIPQPDTKQVA